MNEEIAAVRAYTVPKLTDFETKRPDSSQKLNFDRTFTFNTESTTDLYQNHKFRYFEIHQHGILEHRGLFYDPNTVKAKEKTILESYCNQNKITLYTLVEFRQIFLHEAYDLQALCIGFNLSFDLSRIAIRASNSRF